jgi:hypothetical protein
MALLPGAALRRRYRLELWDLSGRALIATKPGIPSRLCFLLMPTGLGSISASVKRNGGFVTVTDDVRIVSRGLAGRRAATTASCHCALVSARRVSQRGSGDEVSLHIEVVVDGDMKALG